jgi:hypothetical protein
MPSTNTAEIAVCHVNPMAPQTLKAIKAFIPKPEARAMGSFPTKAITNVAVPADIAVAVNTRPASIPAAVIIPGCTAKMYTMLKKVTIPPIISRGTVEPDSVTPKNWSIDFMRILLSFSFVWQNQIKDTTHNSGKG